MTALACCNVYIKIVFAGAPGARKFTFKSTHLIGSNSLSLFSNMECSAYLLSSVTFSIKSAVGVKYPHP